MWMRDLSGHPDAQEYPQAEMVERYGPFFLETSSIAFILAKAIAHCEDNRVEGEDDMIGLFGIMQSSPTEFTYQRPGIQYYIQRAVDAGIDVMCPAEAQLFTPRVMNF